MGGDLSARKPPYFILNERANSHYEKKSLLNLLTPSIKYAYIFLYSCYVCLIICLRFRQNQNITTSSCQFS